jgi:chromosome segregation ATPase
MAVLDRLAIPPRLLVRALDDLHTLAEGVRRLTEREGDLNALLRSVQELPRVEDELSARVDALHRWLEPLHTELTDLDDTAEKLEKALAGVQATIQGLHEEIVELRGKVPGI